MNQEFRKVLLEIKGKYNVTQEQIAIEIGYNRTYLSSVASGKYEFTGELRSALMLKYPLAFPTNVEPDTPKLDTNSNYLEIIDRLTKQVSILVEQNQRLMELLAAKKD